MRTLKERRARAKEYSIERNKITGKKWRREMNEIAEEKGLCMHCRKEERSIGKRSCVNCRVKAHEYYRNYRKKNAN
jgi:hypothetical protein